MDTAYDDLTPAVETVSEKIKSKPKSLQKFDKKLFGKNKCYKFKS